MIAGQQGTLVPEEHSLPVLTLEFPGLVGLFLLFSFGRLITGYRQWSFLFRVRSHTWLSRQRW